MKTLYLGMVSMLTLMLAACSGIPQEDIPVVDSEAVAVVDNEQQQGLRELLLKADKAIREDRLTTPTANNAFEYYQQVLKLDPNNELALNGKSVIIERYVQLVERSLAKNKLSSAATFLQRAEHVNDQHPSVAMLRNRILALLNADDRIYHLSLASLDKRTVSIQEQLKGIGKIAQEKQATVMITARNDKEARWIYQQLKRGAEEFWLRGNTMLGDVPSVRLDYKAE